MSDSRSAQSLWHQLLDARLTRRNLLKGTAAAVGASVLPIDLQAVDAAPGTTQERAARSGATAAQLQPPFRPIRPTTADDLVLPGGYRYNVLRIFGDDVAPGQPFGYNAVQFASGPVECELTGPIWTPDGSTMFLAIQHPGEESESFQKLTSHRPNLQGDPVPRPGVVAITGFPGWKR